MEKEFDQEERRESEELEKKTEDVFAVKEIEVEEMAIDGICGVY